MPTGWEVFLFPRVRKTFREFFHNRRIAMSRENKLATRFACAIIQGLPDVSAEKMEWFMKHPKVLRIFLASLPSRRFFREMRAKIEKCLSDESHSDCDGCW